MNTNADITVYNRFYGDDPDIPTWRKTHIKGVNWYTKTEIGFGTTGVMTANLFNIRIPVDADFGGKAYVSELDYKTTQDRTNAWTLQTEDFIVKGLVDDEITSSFTVAELQDKYADNIGKIISFRENLRGSKPVQHWAVMCQ